tara:strand:- start:4388 stop:5635 length:1248 start_codon:yes stop_codon:yes gene_type:complete
MHILAIETSCDETAVSLVDCSGDPWKGGVNFNVLSNIVLSQAKLHAEYGGVYPSLAKREHAENLIPVLKKALELSSLESGIRNQESGIDTQKLEKILQREPELLKQFLEFIPTIEKPAIDKIVVTRGPGLEPALWVGINFAKALGEVWNIPVSGINHMEGHVFSALLQKRRDLPQLTTYNLQPTTFPALALLISGGHTELVLMKDWLKYEIVGETKDDAVGEAFDKVARMLGLGYPGGPEIARQAAQFQDKPSLKLPRPMLDSGDFNFSFSGLKTAVLYEIKKNNKFQPEADPPSRPEADQPQAGAETSKIIQEFAHEFQEAATDVLVSKTVKAAREYGAKTILVGGGVSANQRIRDALTEQTTNNLPPTTKLLLSPLELTGDNALMIAVAGYLRAALNKECREEIAAHGTLRLA